MTDLDHLRDLEDDRRADWQDMPPEELASDLLTWPKMEQRSPEWYEARRGIVTASAVNRLVTPKTIKVANNDDSRGLATVLASERITGTVEESWINRDMERGILAEPYARAVYVQHHAPVEEIGFMVRDYGTFRLGYSPDGLVGDDGLIEIKAPRPKNHVACVVAGEVPAEYMAQLQTGLLVSGREWCDFIPYVGGLPLWRKRVTPDPKWRAAILAATAQAEKAIRETVAKYQAAVVGLPETERIDFNTVELKL